MKTLLKTCVTGLLALTALPASAATICTYDPAGKSGEYYKLMSDFALEASAWGETIEIKAYTDEETASKDYEAGTCDGVVATGVRLQRFNRFPSTLEAMGALPDYALLGQLVNTLATSDGASAKLVKDGNETVGFISVGAAYLFVRDRSVDSVPELAGKRIATMDYDKAAPAMVERVGAIMVAADLGTIGPKFNNGAVDACYVSAPAYEPFELHRGIGDKGGILRSPLAQATLQVMVRQSKFKEGFGKKARTWFAGKFEDTVAIAQKAEAAIPAKYWVDIPASEADGWAQMFREVRIKLRDEGSYDGQMLKVMRQLRCKADSARAECAENKE
ncbi:MAG: putative solute-binding protein [Myxococcota bacterium]